MRRFSTLLSIAAGALLLLVLAPAALADDDHDRDMQARMGQGAAFISLLSGPREVPPTSSDGRGLASYLLSQDGTTLYYTLEVTGPTSTVQAAHVHLGRRGENGPVIVNLCGAGGTPACGLEGVIATGSVTSANLVGPLAGKSLDDLLAEMGDGNTYSNVHTSNFPGGEIRGQNHPLPSARRHGDDNDREDD